MNDYAAWQEFLDDFDKGCRTAFLSYSFAAHLRDGKTEDDLAAPGGRVADYREEFLSRVARQLPGFSKIGVISTDDPRKAQMDALMRGGTLDGSHESLPELTPEQQAQLDRFTTALTQAEGGTP